MLCSVKFIGCASRAHPLRNHLINRPLPRASDKERETHADHQEMILVTFPCCLPNQFMKNPFWRCEVVMAPSIITIVWKNAFISHPRHSEIHCIVRICNHSAHTDQNIIVLSRTKSRGKICSRDKLPRSYSTHQLVAADRETGLVRCIVRSDLDIKDGNNGGIPGRFAWPW